MSIIKLKTKIKVGLLFLTVIIFFNIFIYEFDRIITPTLIAVAGAEIRAKSTDIINTAIINEYSKKFNYDDVIHIEKDNNGNIVMLKADTLKMNSIACNVAINTQKQLKEIGQIGVKVPVGYILKNNVLSSLGPKITIKMEPQGYVETKYLSEFESSGINQTRHRIYVEVTATLKILAPLKNGEIITRNEVPIAETIIVGKTPDSTINLDLKNAGFKLGDKSDSNTERNR